MHGRLIVIDGTDGTGKTTQTGLLVKRLRSSNKRVAMADFPRYGLPSAYFVERYLTGRYGKADTVNAYAASLFYALDRFDAKATLTKQLAAGRILISNRYVSASMGHQGGKLASAKAKREYFQWIDWLEHDVLGLPRPTATIILHLPAAAAQRLVDRKGRRAYIRRKRDVHEADLKHLKAAEQTFLTIAKAFPSFHVVDCMERNRLLTPLEVHDRVWKIVQELV